MAKIKDILSEESKDPWAGQPTGIKIHMKHKETGKDSEVTFLGTHGAVDEARKHIKQKEKEGYALHKKELVY